MPSPAPFDPRRVDLESFHRGIRALRQELDAALGEEDLAHLRRFERRGHLATLLGLATAWLGLNPGSAVLISLGRSLRWIAMHHIGHRGYDQVPGVPFSRTSRGFARGWRRYLDWPEWMAPDAWNYEHNVLHHAHTGEDLDPDLVERHARIGLWLPMPLRALGLLLAAATWRTTYYAPSTILALRRRDGHPQMDARFWAVVVWRSWLPYVAFHFLLLPALFLPLGVKAALAVLANTLVAEVLTNLHTFLVIVPNHTGSDLYRFDSPPADKAERYVHQVVGSVNFATGSELIDTAHLWLNYQIEHHVFPDMPMLKYRAMQPKLKALCQAHGVPYVQESVWRRAGKMINIALSREVMQRYPRQTQAAPVAHEPRAAAG